MNIAILIPSLASGGAERVASIIGNYYSDRGHKVWFFLGDYRMPRQYGRYKIKGKAINSGIRFVIGKSSIVELISAVKKMRALKRKYRIDVAVSFMEEFNYINILSRGSEKVIVRICRILSIDPYNVRSIFLNKSVLCTMYNMADHVIVMSDYAANDMRLEYGIKSKKLRKISNPVSEIIGSDDKGTWKFGEKAIICVGRLETEKQHNIAVKVFRIVSERDKDAQLVILGEGHYRDRIQRMAEQLGLSDRIHLLGFQTDVYYYLRHAKVFLMASKTEGFPNAMLEAMNAGLPVVAADCPGGTAEILGKERDGDCYCRYGILMPYMVDDDYNAEHISHAERKLGNTLTDLLHNEEMLDKYHHMSLERAKEYQIDHIMKYWDRLIEGLHDTE